MQGVAAKLLANLTVDIKQLITTPESFRALKGAAAKTWQTRETKGRKNNTIMHKLHGGLTTPLKGSPAIQCLIDPKTIQTDTTVIPGNNTDLSKNTPEGKWISVWLLDEAAGNSLTDPGTEQPVVKKTFEPTLLTRKTDPLNPAWVKVILAEVTIDQDLTPEQVN
jgi:hypothetical protein